MEVGLHNLIDRETRDRIVGEIVARTGAPAKQGKRFAELTSLRVGGAIDWVLSPVTEEQAAQVVHELNEAGVMWRVLGAGSNVLADDAEHHYVVMNMRDLKGVAEFDGEQVSVSAGYSLPRLCIEAARAGLAGIEGLGGIPGTIGGALWMNAGAYGNEIGTVVESVRVAQGGRVVTLPGKAVEWNYRHTSFKSGDLLLGATLRLTPDAREEIERRMETAKRQRLATQPHGARSAGCFFKNFPGGSTGRMLDELGLKGSRRGGALVSPVHANFIVTDGQAASATDTLALAEEIRERVRVERGIELEYEVELWKAQHAQAQANGERDKQETQSGENAVELTESETVEKAKR